MSQQVVEKKRVKRVIRAIIVGVSPSGERELLLLQRAKTVRRYPRFWECPGGTLKRAENEKAIHALIREGSEELGIVISRIVAEVHNEKRAWVVQPGDKEVYDEYHATHYLVETPTIKRVELSQEHSGHGWFPERLALLMKAFIRPSTHNAIRAMWMNPPAVLQDLRINPKHR